MMKIVPIDRTAGVEEYVLLSGKEYTVGRKHSEIILPKDPSISRNHAIVQVDHPVANVTNAVLVPSLVITDLGSKFGTFINDGIEASRPVSMREPNTLSHGDRFRFGLVSAAFRIEYTPLTTCSSGIKTLSNLKKTICTLGGHLIPEWTDQCDYLIMESVTLTVKVVCAMLSAKSIVTPAYFDDYLEAVRTRKSSLPKADDYLPVLAESSLPKTVSFRPDERRKRLFENKLFLFFTTKQTKKIGVAVKCGGGRIDLLSSVSPGALRSPSTLVVASNEDLPPNKAIKSALDTYLSTKKRMIQESEVGLAAVYMSLEKYCNPLFKLSTKTVLPHIGTQSQTQEFGLSEGGEMETEQQVGGAGDKETVQPETNSKAAKPDERGEESAMRKKRKGSTTETQESGSTGGDVETTKVEVGGREDMDTGEPETKKSKVNKSEESAMRSKRRLEAEAGPAPSPKKVCHQNTASTVKKLYQDENSVHLVDEKPVLRPAKTIFKPLLMKRDIPILQGDNAHNESLKNFKVFKKVLPVIQSDENSTITITTRTTSTISFRRYNPCETKSDFFQQTKIPVQMEREKSPEFGDPL